MSGPDATSATSRSHPADPLVEIDHVVFGYDASRTILNDVSLTLRPRQGHRHPRRLGLRQDDAAAPDRRRPFGRTQGSGRASRRGRRRTRRGAAVRAAAPARHAVPVRRAVHRPLGLRERRLPAARAHRPRRGDDPRHRADEAERGRPARRRHAAHLGDLGRHGAPRRPRARDRARPRAPHVRRAVRRPRPDLDGDRRQPDPHAQRHDRRHVASSSRTTSTSASRSATTPT